MSPYMEWLKDILAAVGMIVFVAAFWLLCDGGGALVLHLMAGRSP